MGGLLDGEIIIIVISAPLVTLDLNKNGGKVVKRSNFDFLSLIMYVIFTASKIVHVREWSWDN